MTMGKPVIKTECYDRKPGDVNRYDFLWALDHRLNPAAKSSAKVAFEPTSTLKPALKKKTKPVTPISAPSSN
jgi:hypothetical protein